VELDCWKGSGELRWGLLMALTDFEESELDCALAVIIEDTPGLPTTEKSSTSSLERGATSIEDEDEEDEEEEDDDDD
jgi:hypothetical protein